MNRTDETPISDVAAEALRNWLQAQLFNTWLPGSETPVSLAILDGQTVDERLAVFKGVVHRCSKLAQAIKELPVVDQYRLTIQLWGEQHVGPSQVDLLWPPASQFDVHKSPFRLPHAIPAVMPINPD